MSILKLVAYFLFGITEVFLQVLAVLFHTDYNTANIWFYCIVGPIVFLTLFFALWTETAHGIIAHFRDMSMVSNVLLAAVLFFIVLMLVQVTWSALPVFHALAVGDKDVLFNHCVDYLLKENLGMSYVGVNVFYFCILGPMIFLLLTFLVTTGLHQFSRHWLAVFHEPHAWRYWLNATLLFAMLPCCHYALYVLKHYVLSR